MYFNSETKISFTDIHNITIIIIPPSRQLVFPLQFTIPPFLLWGNQVILLMEQLAFLHLWREHELVITLHSGFLNLLTEITIH